MSPIEPESLARLLLEGDATATAEVRARVRKILAFRGYGIPTEERLDLEQTVMLQLWQAVGRPGFEPGKLWGFLEVLAARRCIDWLRTRSPPSAELSEAIEDPGDDPSEAAVRRQSSERVRAAVQSLPEPCRRLIDLHIAQGKSYREISAILGKSEGALRVQMSRCVKRAGDLLQQAGENSPSNV